MNGFWRIAIVSGVTLLTIAPASAQSGKSLAKCEKTMGRQMTKYSGAVQKAVSKCMDKIAKEVIAANDPIADAAKSCASALRKIENSEDATKTLSAKFRAKVGKACDPNSPRTKATHTDAEVLDPNEAGGLGANLLDDYCSEFGGDGALDTTTEWIACADKAAVCHALQQVAVEYPRGPGWLADVATAIGALDPNSPKYTDAQTAANAIRLQIDADLNDVPDIACGPATADSCGNGVVDGAAESCDGNDMNGESCGSLGYTATSDLGCTSDCRFDLSACWAAWPNPPSRFRDNGDGTATDIVSGLQWELKNSLDSGQDPNNVHDADNSYTWCADAAPFDFNCDDAAYPFDGTAATVFLATLNSDPCLAGHCDWRLPTINELRGLLPIESTCSSAPCIDPDFPGDTRASFYWSSITDTTDPAAAWDMNFLNGSPNYGDKAGDTSVRAVRRSW